MEKEEEKGGREEKGERERGREGGQGAGGVQKCNMRLKCCSYLHYKLNWLASGTAAPYEYTPSPCS